MTRTGKYHPQHDLHFTNMGYGQLTISTLPCILENSAVQLIPSCSVTGLSPSRQISVDDLKIGCNIFLPLHFQITIHSHPISHSTLRNVLTI